MQISRNIKVILLMERNQEKEFIIIKLEENIKVSGSMIKNMDSEPFNMQMEINMKEFGEMDKDGKMEFINTPMVMFMKVNGEMISNKVMENLIWQLEINTKDSGKEARKMAKVNIFIFRSVHFRKWRYLLRRVLEWKQARRRYIHLDRPKLLQRIMAS